MRYCSWSIVVLGLAGLCAATPLNKRWDDFEVKHAWIDTPRGWKLKGAAPADHKMTMRVGLKQDGFDKLIESLYEVSNPKHGKYGAHLSKEEVDALVAPHSTTVELVESWLVHHGIEPESATTRSGAGDWLTIVVSVDQANRMLGTEYNVYQHETTDETIVRTMSYSLPSALHGHVEVISPTTYFGTMRSMKATSFLQPQPDVTDSDVKDELINVGSLAVPSSCERKITPSCLQALYNFTSYTPQATDTNIIGVSGYLDEYANYADLQSFFDQFRTDAKGTNFTTVQVNDGGNNQSDPGVEANLDIQYTEGLTFPTPNIYYSTGGSPPYNPDSATTSDTNEPYLDWLNFILNQTTIPQTFTTSYGDDEQTVPYDYAKSVCGLFAQLGARGSSAMFSSGDSGVGADDCTTNNGSSTVVFQPIFPASCPYVTAVGGTTGISPEAAVDFSSGGFSNYFAQPDYQSEAVPNFISALGNNYTGLYNASGRGFPDVAAQGQYFQVVIGGQTQNVAGTSASCPTFASVVTLLNDYRIANNKSSLGFLNPLLYSNPSGFNDITSGSNPGCNTDGFTATTGWDPVTGLGTPDFGKLQAIVDAA